MPKIYSDFFCRFYSLLLIHIPNLALSRSLGCLSVCLYLINSRTPYGLWLVYSTDHFILSKQLLENCCDRFKIHKYKLFGLEKKVFVYVCCCCCCFVLLFVAFFVLVRNLEIQIQIHGTLSWSDWVCVCARCTRLYTVYFAHSHNFLATNE